MATVLQAFGFGPGTTIEREFSTEFGRPKALIRVHPAGRLFVGSLGVGWPSADQLNWVLPRLNEIGARMQGLSNDVTLGPYLRARGGAFVVREGPHHHFVTPTFDGREARPGTDGTWMAHGLGLFHLAARQCFSVDPPEASRHGSVVGMFRHFVRPTLTGPAGVGMSDPQGRMGRARELAGWIAEHRAAAIDSLPASFAHGDFQPKNLLLGRGLDGREMLRIIDAEHASIQSRLHDLYFLWMGDDAGTSLGDFAQFAKLLGRYARLAGPLSHDEVHLLPNVLQTKALGVIAWACNEYQSSPEGRSRLLVACAQAALRCVDLVHEGRERIREIARSAGA